MVSFLFHWRGREKDKEVMRELRAEGRQFDLIFLDADKAGYVDYYKASS